MALVNQSSYLKTYGRCDAGELELWTCYDLSSIYLGNETKHFDVEIKITPAQGQILIRDILFVRSVNGVLTDFESSVAENTYNFSVHYDQKYATPNGGFNYSFDSIEAKKIRFRISLPETFAEENVLVEVFLRPQMN